MSISLFARVHALVLVVGSVAAALLFVVCGSVTGAWASSSCPNEVFRTGAGASLPDCRAYELVSPADKNGGQVDGGLVPFTELAPGQAAANGEAVTYGSQSTFTVADPASSLATVQYLSRRGPDGWSTQAVTPRQNPGPTAHLRSDEFSLVKGFSEDLSWSFVLAGEPAPVAGAPGGGFLNPYLRDDEDGSYTLLSTATPAVGGIPLQDLEVSYAGMSADGSHVIFAANEALTPRAVAGSVNLYEWSAAGGLELVSVLPPNEEPDSEGGTEVLGLGATLEFGASNHDANESNNDLVANYSRAISTDGDRVFWSAVIGSEEHLYMHEVTGGGMARTVEVSASQDAMQPSSASSHYWTASAEGSLVYFTSCADLTSNSTAEVGNLECSQDDQGDLYQYDADTGVLKDLTVDANPGETADVLGVLGAGEDGSYIYFAALGKLAPDAVAGAYNIYVWHEGVTSFIGDGASEADGKGGITDWSQELAERTSRVSPDGRYLAFQSEVPLTGYDNVETKPGVCHPAEEDQTVSHELAHGRCMEVYEYSADTGSLVCASCNPSGLPPVGNSTVPGTLHGFGEVFTGWQTATVQQRYLLNNGRVFFTSDDELLPQASDGKQNVYEEEPDGVGSCAGVGGCLYLISSGTSNENSYFMDASADGSNVFFLTAQQLVSEDGDEAFDVYDARVGGGFEAPSAPACGGEACRAPVTAAPSIYGAPSSATFAGAGNPAPVVSSATPKQATKKKKKAKPKKKTKKKKSKGKKKAKARKSNNGRRSEWGGRR